jgi:hypothetical protein
LFWRGLGGTKLALGAGGSGAAVIAIIALLLLAFGKCNFLFHPVGSVQTTPTPTSSTTVVGTPTPTAQATTTPTATPTSTPTSTPTATPTAAAAALFITSLPWHQGEVSVPYTAVTLVARGGTPPYKWSISGGALPDGLALSTDGIVSGNPNVTGGPFTVRVDDNAGQAAGARTTIPIAQRFAPTSYCGANGCLVEVGCANVCGTWVNLNGGVGPFQYGAPSAAIPPGTTFAGPALGGSFIRPGSYPFTVSIADSFGVTVPVTALFNVFSHLALSAGGGGGQLPNGPATVTMALATYAATTITAITITEGPNYSVIPGSISYDGKYLTFKIAGSWVGTNQPPFNATVYDNYFCGTGVRCSSTNTVTLSMG